jgi:hypothetical protein
VEKNVAGLMSKVIYIKTILFYAAVATIFFPLKGFIPFVSQYVLGNDINEYSGILILTVIMPLIIYACLKHSHIKKTSESFFFAVFAFIGLTFSLLNKDTPFLYYTIIIFVYPMVFSWIKQVDDLIVIRLFGIFFKFTILFILIEYLVINLQFFGEISYEQIQAYQSSFTSTTLKTIHDSRHHGGIYRTGGYLGNLLVMPCFVLFAFIFCYINNKVQQSYKSFFWVAAGAIALFSSGSATVILSGLISILFYEVLICRNYRFVIMTLIIIITLGIFLYDSITPIKYVFERLYSNIMNPKYIAHFIAIDNAEIQQLQLFLIGGWNSIFFTSHNDFLKVLFMFGIFPVSLVIRRWYSAIIFGLKAPQSSYAHLYAMMLIALIITFVHHQMGLTVYPMIFASIMLLRIEKAKN